MVSLVLVGVTVYHAVQLLGRSLQGLMDAVRPDIRAGVITALQARVGQDLVGFHDVRLRDGGGHLFIDFHLQFPEGTSLEAAHDLAEVIEDEVEATVSSAEATAHIEPFDQVRGDREAAPRAASPREAGRRKAATVSLVTAVTLTVVKLTAAALTGSAAVLSDGLESLVNIVAAGFAVFSVRVSRSGADARHPYGHYKIEFLAAALEGGMIILAATLIIAAAVPRLLSGAEASNLEMGLALVAGAAIANAVLGVYLVRAGRRLASLTLEADGHHVLSDVVTSAGVLVGLAVVRLTGWAPADPLTAIALAFYILWAGLRLVARAFGGLTDRVDPAVGAAAARVLDEAKAAGRIIGWHKLRVRDAGARRFLEAHIQLPEGASLADAHQVSEEIEAELEAALHPADAILHAEPASEAR
jgi:cation diffusion facilitator family transporter